MEKERGPSRLTQGTPENARGRLPKLLPWPERARSRPVPEIARGSLPEQLLITRPAPENARGRLPELLLWSEPARLRPGLENARGNLPEQLLVTKINRFCDKICDPQKFWRMNCTSSKATLLFYGEVQLIG